MSRGLKIDIDGTITVMDSMGYEAIREALGGGWLEGKQLPDGNFMYMDEEGKLKGLAPNKLATALNGTWLFPGDYIAGVAVVAGPPDEEGDHLDVTAEDIMAIRARAANL